MSLARTIVALAAAAAVMLVARAARADCADPSCPKEVAAAMAKSAARPPLVLSVGLRSLSYAPNARDRFDGGVQTSPMGYTFQGDALGGSTLRAWGGELGLDWAFTPFTYVGVAGAWGVGEWSSQPFQAGSLMVEPRATVNARLWLTGLRAGVRLPLGPVSFRAEMLGGAEWISLQQLATVAATSMTADASSAMWLLEPRVAVDLWTTPYTAFSVYGTMPGFDSRATNGGIAFAIHVRSFDGRYTGVL